VLALRFFFCRYSVSNKTLSGALKAGATVLSLDSGVDLRVQGNESGRSPTSVRGMRSRAEEVRTKKSDQCTRYESGGCLKYLVEHNADAGLGYETAELTADIGTIQHGNYYR
jgi:hypothetical protein